MVGSFAARLGEAPSNQPYLSVVVASRNDDHGGNLLDRMQVFVDGLLEQCRRHDLDAELILVEWNPPQDRPRLADALRWPSEPTPCAVRIIEVPSALHLRYRHADSLPLFQMIAKNVGIRRARGRFVLATNIDILFSEALLTRLAKRGLSEGYMYRVDRYDVPEDVPVGAPVRETLAYCQGNVVRRHGRTGIRNLATGHFDAIYPSRLRLLLRALIAVIPPLAPLAMLSRTLLLSSERKRIVGRILRRRRRRHRRLRRIAGRRRASYVWIRILARARRYARTTRSAWRDVRFEARRGRLHTNACGDFTLMARRRWHDLRGYPEFEMYSFHLDTLLCHAAVCAGATEAVFRDPARIYHIGHAQGSGFTPEGQQGLWSRLRSEGIRRLSDDELWRTVIDMRRRRRSPLFNGERWGLEGHQLREHSVLPIAGVAAEEQQ